MKTILKGNEAIEIYEKLQGSLSAGTTPRMCGYFISDDYDATKQIYDKGSIVAFDSTTGQVYEDVFSNVNDAIEWINK